MSKENPRDTLLLSNDARPDAAYILANSPWFRYHRSPDRAWATWDNTFAVLRVQAKRGSSTVTHCMLAFASLTSIDGMAWTNMTHTPPRAGGARDHDGPEGFGLSVAGPCPRIGHRRT
ncbi:hypothetical protein BC826DRAFT_508863 [Russula brevipes]|nr:hypothetical protein BC826DRAFT_508863 [Russula brevipes]